MRLGCAGSRLEEEEGAGGGGRHGINRGGAPWEHADDSPVGYLLMSSERSATHYAEVCFLGRVSFGYSWPSVGCMR